MWLLAHDIKLISRTNDILCVRLLSVVLTDHCRASRNFNAMFAILSGLGHASVSRLKQTWDKLPAKYAKMFEVPIILRILLSYSPVSPVSSRCRLCGDLWVIGVPRSWPEPGLAGFIRAKDNGNGGDNGSCKTCKAPVTTNNPTPNFLQARHVVYATITSPTTQTSHLRWI